MSVPAYSPSSELYCKGRQASYLRAWESPGAILDMIEVARPAGNMSRPGLPEFVLYQDLVGGSRVAGDLGGGRFDVMGKSRLLARAAGYEILAELCRLGGAPLTTAKGGLAPWAKWRCLELMRTRFAEDMSLDELAAEVQLSPFHFARMFKRSLGSPPRVYLTRRRVEKARGLLEQTDLSSTQIALDVGYSPNQVLARVFLKHMRLSPSDYRRAVRDTVRPSIFGRAGPVVEGPQ